MARGMCYPNVHIRPRFANRFCQASALTQWFSSAPSLLLNKGIKFSLLRILEGGRYCAGCCVVRGEFRGSVGLVFLLIWYRSQMVNRADV